MAPNIVRQPTRQPKTRRNIAWPYVTRNMLTRKHLGPLLLTALHPRSGSSGVTLFSASHSICSLLPRTPRECKRERNVPAGHRLGKEREGCRLSLTHSLTHSLTLSLSFQGLILSYVFNRGTGLLPTAYCRPPTACCSPSYSPDTLARLRWRQTQVCRG